MDIDLINQNLAQTSLSRAKKQVENKEHRQLKEQQLKQACEGFESIFLHTVLKSMRSSLPGDAVFNESNGSNIYKSMYDQYLSEDLSKGNTSIGLKEFLFQQLKDTV